MLVLSRKKGEAIVIGDDIELVVLETEGDTVRLGIKAPKNVQIFRQEIYEAIKQSNHAASVSTVDIKKLSKLMKNEENERK